MADLASPYTIPVAEGCGNWPVRNCRQWGRWSLPDLGSLCANVHMHVAVSKYMCAGKCTSVDVLCAVSAASTCEKEPKVGGEFPVQFLLSLLLPWNLRPQKPTFGLLHFILEGHGAPPPGGTSAVGRRCILGRVILQQHHIGS